MFKVSSFLACVAVATMTSFTGACTETTSATGLNPAGPPMVTQVRLLENFVDASGTHIERPKPVFAFGTHPEGCVEGQPCDDPSGLQHKVETARPTGNQLRIIMDELLVGNNLEEIQCRAVIDEDAYDRVPLGATPDDVARCSQPRDVLPQTCVGGNPICICHLDAGCLVPGTPPKMVDKGQPVGITDIDKDGAADDTRFIVGAVGISCMSPTGPQQVLLNLESSYWTPSGNQRVPAQGGFDVLGPAVVLTPQNPLPTNQVCGLTFAPDVVDKDGNQACAPPNGALFEETAGLEQGPPTTCAPLDFSAFSFKVEPLTLDAGIPNNATNIGRTDDINIRSNTPLASNAAGLVTITANGNPTPFTASLQNMDRSIVISPPLGGGFPAQTTLVLTIPVTVTDAQGSPLPAPIVITFMTGDL